MTPDDYTDRELLDVLEDAADLGDDPLDEV